MLVAAAVALLAFAPLAHADKFVTEYHLPDSQANFGDEAGSADAIAINQDGNGAPAGTIYVADDNLNRVTRFGPDAGFQRVWGANVSGRDERQLIAVSGGNPGETFTLSFGGNTTPPLTLLAQGSAGALNGPTANQVKSALEALPSIGAGNVTVSGGATNFDSPQTIDWTVRFVGALTGTDVAQITATVPAVGTTIEDGSGGSFSGFEICTVAVECQDGSTLVSTGNGGQLNSPQGIGVNQATGDVYVLEGNNRRVSQFDADGNWIRSWGWDVVSTGGLGDVSADAFEICTVAADCKQAATAGGDGGRFGIFPRDLQIDPSGNVWVADTANLRLQKFDAAGNFIAVYGWDVDAIGGDGALESCTSTAPGDCQAAPIGNSLGQFGASFTPFFFTFDSAGNIYTEEKNPGSRVQRFNPAFTAAVSFFEDPGISGNASPILALPGSDHILLSLEKAAENQLVELDPAGLITDTYLAGFRLPRLEGLAVNETTGTIYVSPSIISPNGSRLSKDRRYRLLELGDTEPPPPVASLDPVVTFDDSSATLTGTIDPNGNPVTDCSFQYSVDENAWVDVPEADCEFLASDGGPQVVGEEVTGLQPGTHYFIRLIAKRLYGPAQSVATEEFVTASLPPVLSGLGAAFVTDSSAYLVGDVIPRSQLTNYHFEYSTTNDFSDCGTTENPGCLTTPEADIVGAADALAAAQVSGLTPDTEYHFKLVASNVAGTTESAVFTLHTRADSPPSPTERAYEMVSPPEKNGGGALVGYPQAGAAYDGTGVGFRTTSLFGDPPGVQTGHVADSTGVAAHYFSRRTSTGWRTRAAHLAICNTDFDDPSHDNRVGMEIEFSLNFERSIFTRPEFTGPDCPSPLLDAAAPEPSRNLYREDLLAAASFDLLAPAPGFGAASQINDAGIFAAGSDDFSQIVYLSTGAQTPDAAAPAAGFYQVYEWDEGTLRLASKDPAGNTLTSPSHVPGGGAVGGGGKPDSFNAVSADGNRVFFQNPSSNGTNADDCTNADCELYMREDGTQTHWVSEQECSPACSNTAAADVFRYASPDGSRVLFSTAAKLLNDDTSAAGADLYLYSHTAEPAIDENLTLLSGDDETADGSSAGVQGVLGLSDDGETVFFAANGQLVSGENTEAGPKLYRWQLNGGSPTLDYLGTLQGGESANWISANPVRTVTPSGEYLLVASAARLDPLADHDSSADIYRWDEQGGWVCASCQTPGIASQGGAGFGSIAAEANERKIAIADDGQRVFFNTPDSLLPADTNSPLPDVYEWHDSTLNLISTGTDTAGDRFLGASHDGRDVFFSSDQRLVGWDTDSANDIYDARIGGGFPEPQPGAPCDLNAGACEGPGTDAPDASGAGTSAFTGPGNQASTPRRNCRSFGRGAQKQSRAARRAQRAARRVRNPRRAKRLRRRAARLARAARKNAKRAKRCRQANRRTTR